MTHHTQPGELMLPANIRRRSRAGCTACRRQHRKCDEQRPACIPCRARGLECDYQRPLKWTSLDSFSTFRRPKPARCTSANLTASRHLASPSPPRSHPGSEAAEWPAQTAELSQCPAGRAIDDSDLLTIHTRQPELEFSLSPPAVIQSQESQPRNTACLPHSNLIQGEPMDELEELQAEDYLGDDDNDPGDGDLGELLDSAAQISDITEHSSSPSDSGSWVIDSTLGNLFSQTFQHPGDEIAFTYYFKRVCSCTTAYDGNPNPYRKLALMALSYPVLLHGILSVSTAHMDMYGRSNESILFSRQLRALRSLQAALDLLQRGRDWNTKTDQKSEYTSEADGVFSILSTKEITLAAVMMQTSSILMVGICNVERHMTCALYLIQYLGYLHRAPRSVFTRTLIHRFAMVDVVVALIRFRHPQAPLRFFMYQDHEELDREEPSFREMHGCHQRVLSFLAQIAALSTNLAKVGSPQSEIQARGYNLETEMRFWGRGYYDAMVTESTPSASLPRTPYRRPNGRTDLDVVCECFYWTAHILLLRRVFLDPTNSTRVQLIRRRLFKLIDSLVVGCGPDSSLPFPFYMAAREATTLEDQDWVRRKHAEMFDIYRDRAREFLMTSTEKIWANAVVEAIPVSDDTLSWERPLEHFIRTMDKEATHFLF